ncbi:MAG: glycoside hydrolase family 127 protein [Clostridia bacterium]|nr:glycoside hydrolase family 127 protein [Clostridia bacterium]
MIQKYPKVGTVELRDPFWTPYIENIRRITLPYTFKKIEEAGYVKNFESVAAKDGAEHHGYHFADGNYLECIRGACDFLAAEADPILEAYIDHIIEILTAASDAEGGFISTATTQLCPHQRWGDNGGDIVTQHDLYNHGTLVEAAVSHYNATGKTTLLRLAVRAADLICDTIGKHPKKNIVPGHSLPEEAFVKLYRLLRDDPALAEFAARRQEYLDIAEFWYDARGNHEGRFLSKNERFTPPYSQDHAPFAEQKEAVGHSVRAMLCYLGATVVAQEKGRADYMDSLHALWESVVYKKLHISGGIGSRHDIEGFDVNYHLPNTAYLETCAAIGLAFWNTEMALSDPDAKYFDCFERSLYNNILDAIGADFKHFFYQNPLENDGTMRRWEWHKCPCCPPMLLKIFGALNSFIYSYNEDTLSVHLHIGSRYENEQFSVEQAEGKLILNTKGKPMTLRIRIPEYAENFTLSQPYTVEKGYAVLHGVWSAEQPLEVHFEQALRRIYANPKVEDDQGKVAVTYGPFVYCVEGNIPTALAKEPCLRTENGKVYARTAEGGEICLIPYYQWCNSEPAPMTVWLPQEEMRPLEELAAEIGEKLYEIYG